MSSQERPYCAGIYAAVLTADGRSPVAPRSGDENAADDTADADNKDAQAADKKPAPVTIAIEGIVGRIVSLPVPEGNYSLLQVGSDDNLYFLEQPQPGNTDCRHCRSEEHTAELQSQMRY